MICRNGQHCPLYWFCQWWQDTVINSTTAHTAHLVEPLVSSLISSISCYLPFKFSPRPDKCRFKVPNWTLGPLFWLFFILSSIYLSYQCSSALLSETPAPSDHEPFNFPKISHTDFPSISLPSFSLVSCWWWLISRMPEIKTFSSLGRPTIAEWLHCLRPALELVDRGTYYRSIEYVYHLHKFTTLNGLSGVCVLALTLGT